MRAAPSPTARDGGPAGVGTGLHEIAGNVSPLAGRSRSKLVVVDL